MNDLSLNECIYEIAIAAQQALPNSPNRRQLVTKLLQTLEQCSDLVRPRLRDMFITCYEMAKQTVHADLCAGIEQEKFAKQNVPHIMNIKLTDQYLRELAIVAQNTPPNSSQRSMYINELLTVVDRSQRLPFRAPKLTMTNDEIRAEAKQRLYQYIYKNIESYDPIRAPVMAWIGFVMKRRYFPEAINNLWNYRPKGVDSETRILSLNELDNVLSMDAKDREPSKAQLLRQHIDDDVDGKYSTDHIKGCPAANFRFITLKRLDGFKWQEISDELDGILVTSLSALYQRGLRKFGPDIRTYLSD